MDATDDGGAADGDSDADAAPTTTLSGEVVLLADDRFQTPLPLLGTGAVHVPTPSGDESVPYGALGGSEYQADNVLVGWNWFSVFPDDAIADAGLSVYPTWSLLDVPQNGSDAFDVPALDRSLLATIYASLAVPMEPRSDASQVVLVFESSGQRVSGVSLTTSPTSDAVAYDVGVGYSTTATATGPTGVALLINARGAGKVEWKAGGGTTGSFTLIHVPGQASFARIVVQ